MLSNFQWWRRLCGGKWARVTGYLWGQRWVSVPYGEQQPCDENWYRGDIMKPLDWWIESVWTPFYCKVSFFHLMRHIKDGSYVVVWQVRGFPVVHGYYIDSSWVTPAGCRRGIQLNKFMDALEKRCGRENLLRMMNAPMDRGPVFVDRAAGTGGGQ